MHTITLFVPALFWPHAAIGHDSPTLPALRSLIGRGEVIESQCEDERAWLCGQFGVRQQADWPAAPIAVLGDGLSPGEDFWLSADPVHLRVNRDQLTLLAPDGLSITVAEASALCAALNSHFVRDHFCFLAPDPERWYLKAGPPAHIRTTGLSRAFGHDVDHLLPRGEDRLAWHRIFNEVQMLLHAHPVNEERERRGALPINSLWFSGGGTLPAASSPFQAVVGSSALLRGLSKLTQVPFTPVGQGIAGIDANEILVELGDAFKASMRLDAGAWKDALEGLEQRWFAVMRAMLKSGRIRELVVATVANDRSYRWSVKRMNLWRWWRPAASLDIPVRAAP